MEKGELSTLLVKIECSTATKKKDTEVPQKSQRVNIIRFGNPNVSSIATDLIYRHFLFTLLVLNLISHCKI